MFPQIPNCITDELSIYVDVNINVIVPMIPVRYVS